MGNKDWWDQGLKFECQSSGNCCVSRNGHGFVYVTLDDRRRLAKQLRVSTAQFTRKYCEKTEGHYHLKEDTHRPECLFLKEHQCSVYRARPTQCRTWPFWPENMPAKKWDKDVAGFCPGVGRGKRWSAKEINKQLRSQKLADDQI